MFYRSVWKVKARPRMTLFTWTTALRRILTLDNLSKRRIIVVIGDACVNLVRKLQTIFFFIALWLRELF